MKREKIRRRGRATRWRRGYWTLVVAFFCVLPAPQSWANEVQKKAIAQDNACADGLNTITITLQARQD